MKLGIGEIAGDCVKETLNLWGALRRFDVFETHGLPNGNEKLQNNFLDAYGGIVSTDIITTAHNDGCRD